jgi:hypothetical protein
MNPEESADSFLAEPINEILTSFYSLVPISDITMLLQGIGYHFATDELVHGVCVNGDGIAFPIDVESGEVSDEFVSLSELPTFYRLFERVLSEYQEISLLRGFCDYYARAVELGGPPDVVAEIYSRIEDLSINLPGNLVRERAARSGTPIDWLEVIRNVAEDIYGDVERRERVRMTKRLASDDRYDF